MATARMTRRLLKDEAAAAFLGLLVWLALAPLLTLEPLPELDVESDPEPELESEPEPEPEPDPPPESLNLPAAVIVYTLPSAPLV